MSNLQFQAQGLLERQTLYIQLYQIWGKILKKMIKEIPVHGSTFTVK